MPAEWSSWTAQQPFKRIVWRTVDLIRAREKAEHKDSQVMGLVKRTVNHTAEKLISDNARCHKRCYVNFANRSKIERT